MHFGDHIIIDIYNIKDEDLSNEKIIKDTFSEIIKISNMNILSKLHIYKVDNKDLVKSNSEREHGGLTAIQVIKESHISIHTFKNIGYIGFDLFTCKTLDEKTIKSIMNTIKKSFNVKDTDIDFIKIERGKRLSFKK